MKNLGYPVVYLAERHAAGSVERLAIPLEHYSLGIFNIVKADFDAAAKQVNLLNGVFPFQNWVVSSTNLRWPEGRPTDKRLISSCVSVVLLLGWSRKSAILLEL